MLPPVLLLASGASATNGLTTTGGTAVGTCAVIGEKIAGEIVGVGWTTLVTGVISTVGSGINPFKACFNSS